MPSKVKETECQRKRQRKGPRVFEGSVFDQKESFLNFEIMEYRK